jgi:predicted transcriptional regulator
MPHRKFTREETRGHELRAWDLRQRGWTQERIAQELGLERSSISRILSRLDQRFRATMREQVGELKSEQTAILRHIVAESMDAWERSKESAKSVTVKTEGQGAAEGKGKGSTVQQVKDQDGDTVYLDEARAALADIRKIWGADAPARTALTSPDGKEPWSAITPGPGFLEQLHAAGFFKELRRKLGLSPAGAPLPATESASP